MHQTKVDVLRVAEEREARGADKTSGVDDAV
jgi:hypothetical protein